MQGDGGMIIAVGLHVAVRISDDADNMYSHMIDRISTGYADEFTAFDHDQ